MFAAVIVANVIAALFAFLGVGQVICYLTADERPTSATQFLFGLSAACWPLAVAVGIYLLVQIACWLEKLHFAGKNDTAAAKSSVGSVVSSAAPRAGKKTEENNGEDSDAPVFFKAVAPPPDPTSLSDEEMDVKSAAAFAASVDSSRKAEEDEAEHEDVERDVEDNTPPAVPEKPKSGLNFFKID